jgi:hypothetical protein
MNKYSYLILFTFQIFILAFSCEKVKVKTGQLTVGTNWVNLNCGPGIAKVYIDNNLIGTISDVVDTVAQCDQENCLTVTKEAGNHTYKVSFKDDCVYKSGELTILADSCIRLFIKF